MTEQDTAELNAARQALAAAEDALRVKPSGRESPAKRLRRRAANARTEAALATGRAAAVRAQLRFVQAAAKSLRKEGDDAAATLYEEMEGALLDVAEAHEDYATAAADLAEHFEGRLAAGREGVAS